MNLNRRTFLSLLASATLCAAAGDTSAGEPFRLLEKGGSLVASVGMQCARVNLGNGDLKIIKNGFMAHSLLPLAQAGHYVAIEKWGPSCAVLDFENNAIIKTMENDEGDHFFGHGFYAKEQHVYAVSRVSKETQMGYLSLYDAVTHKRVGRIDVAQGALHEAVLLNDGTCLVAAAGLKNLGYYYNTKVQDVAKGALVKLELKSGKILGKMELPDADQNLAHFSVLPTGDIVCCTVQKPGFAVQGGNVYFTNLDGAAFTRCDWGDMAGSFKGEMLSHAVDTSLKTLCVTNPDANNVMLVDMAEKRMTKHYARKIKGIVYDPDKKHFVLCGEGLWALDQNGISKDALAMPLRGLPLQFPVHSLYVPLV